MLPENRLLSKLQSLALAHARALASACARPFPIKTLKEIKIDSGQNGSTKKLIGKGRAQAEAWARARAWAGVLRYGFGGIYRLYPR